MKTLFVKSTDARLIKSDIRHGWHTPISTYSLLNACHNAFYQELDSLTSWYTA
jgi:hypothetical protein